jgi:hypothetical protein
VGFVGLVIETIRCPDMSAGFGLMSSMTQRMLYQQLGAILLSAVVLVMLATARSLYVQMSRPVPAVFVRLMWGVVVINQLFVIPVLVTKLALHVASHAVSWSQQPAVEQRVRRSRRVALPLAVLLVCARANSDR